MIWEEINSKDNKLLRHISKLATDGKYRKSCREYVCEGENLLYEAIRDGADIHAVVWEKESLKEADAERLESCKSRNCRWVKVNESLYRSVNILENYSGALFVCGFSENEAKPEDKQYIALDGVQDPGNVGTMIRVADAFGIDGLWFLEGCADPYQPKAVRAAMGSLFRTKIYRASTDEFFALMKERDIPVYATALYENSKTIGETDLRKAAVVIGSEGHGVTRKVIDNSTHTVIIPMCGGAESLNAAVAGSIVMWEMSKCR